MELARATPTMLPDSTRPIDHPDAVATLVDDKTLNGDLLNFSVGAPDALRRLEEGCFWLEAYRQGVRGDPLRAYQVVDRIDNLMQPHRMAVSREYLDAGGRQQTYRERRIWNAVVHFAHELAAGYEICLQLFRANVRGAKPLKPHIPTATARAIRSLTLILRWNLLRYAAVEPTLWSRMGSLYAYAERERYLSERFKVYPDMHGDSTVRREYLRALVLSVSGMENLLPPNQVAAERVIATLADFFLLHRRPAAGCHFAVDLKASRSPFRVSDSLAPARTVRFFGPGDAAVMLEGLMQRTVETGHVPTEIKLAGDVYASTIHEVLEHLSRQWGPTPPLRSETRQRVLSTLNVANSFDKVLRVVSAEQGGEEIDEITEAWTVENESTGGFGAVLPPLEGDWLAIGTLVAAKPTWPASWSVGIIRRLSTDELGRRAVGVQVLARGGVAVELESLNQSAGAHAAVLLPAETQTSLIGGEVTLLLQRDLIDWSARYTLRVHQRSYIIAPVRLTDSGEDFDIYAFAIEENAAS